MSSFSQDFIELESRVKVLKQKFMAAQLQDENDNPTSFYPDLEFSAAYKLLVHAEIQDYLQKKAKDGLKLIEADVQINGLNTKYLNIIIAIAIACQNDLILKFTHPFSESEFKEKFKLIMTKARSFIKNNNGIKDRSFTVLSIMSCVLKDPFDSVLIGNLDSYGEARGDVAHSSVKSVTSINSPMSEVGYVEKIIEGFKAHFYNNGNAT